MRKCVKIKVVGKVQGVFYRKFVSEHAIKMGIEGTIQNVDDGSVLIFACGLADQLDDFIDMLYEGSSKSKIQDVLVEPLVQEKYFRGVFRTIGTSDT